MTAATDARLQLSRLMAERLDANDAGLAGNRLYLADLDAEIAASRHVYALLALTAIASLRAEVSGPQAG